MIWHHALRRKRSGVSQDNNRTEKMLNFRKACKVAKKVIWHYVFRRDLGVRSAPALHWLWFGAQEATALQGEGS